MADKATPERQTFSRALRAYQAGEMGLDSLLGFIDEELAAGSAASDMRGVMRLNEFITPLDDAVLQAITGRLSHRPRAVAGERSASIPESAGPAPQAPVHVETSRDPIDAPTRASPSVSPVPVEPKEEVSSASNPPPPVTQAPALSEPDVPIAATLRFEEDKTTAGGMTRHKQFLLAGAAALIAAVIVGAMYSRHFRQSQKTIASPTLASSPVVAQKPAPPIVPPARGTPAAGSIINDCPTCLQMTVVPAGRFDQGVSDGDSGARPADQPQHRVTIDHAFAMSTNDVTVGDFEEFAITAGRHFEGCDVYDGSWGNQAAASWRKPGFPQNSHHPVSCISWNDAEAFARYLSRKSGHHYRLPTASEWEYAARAGVAATTPWGQNPASACKNANVADASAARRYPGWNVFPCNDGNVYTAPVGSYKSNPFGLNDMLGNVFVWTEDCWRRNYVGAASDGSAVVNGDCEEHEVRGGSWFSSPQFVTAAYRNHFASNYRTSSVGFRLVRDLD